MSGHSKWHNIRLRKGKQDEVRGKLFTRVAREIIVAAKEGGGNPDTNGRLRLAVEKAREASMPMDNIKRAIERGTGGGQGSNYDEVAYEGHAPGGVAVMVTTLTDNKNRTVAEIRNAFNRGGGSLGTSGCVAWMFESKGIITVPKDSADEDTLMMAVLDAGAQDVNTEDSVFEVVSDPADFQRVVAAISEAGIRYSSADVTMVPTTTVSVEGKQAEQVLRLLEALEDLDDVQEVYSNFDIPEGMLESMGGAG